MEKMVSTENYIPFPKPTIRCRICGAERESKQTGLNIDWWKEELWLRHRWYCWILKLRIKYFGDKS